jgi:hypothetical protein
MLSYEFTKFYENWNRKVEEYRDDDLRTHFDRFFTLYVLYNRLYAETTFEMARNNQIRFVNRSTFPDNTAATDYVVQFIGANNFIDCIEGNQSSKNAFEQLKSLIEKEKFHILLDLITGDSNRQKDLELLELLNSDIAADKAKAITKVVYAIRCNLFHGHKQFAGVQVEILVPVTTILKRIVECLYNKLKTTDLSANHTDGMDTLQN